MVGMLIIKKRYAMLQLVLAIMILMLPLAFENGRNGWQYRDVEHIASATLRSIPVSLLEQKEKLQSIVSISIKLSKKGKISRE
jgi:hypothetical protein